MKTRLAAVLLAGAALASLGVAAGGDTKADLKKFEGTWAVESLQFDGKAEPEDKLRHATYTFAGNKVTQRRIDQQQPEQEEGTFVIDAGEKPRQIDVTTRDQMIVGIYAFEGGKLKLCLVGKGRGRPTRFESPVGGKTALVVLKRVKE
jgi:uncharacterized protein (TIGR03067 family)